jgi:hypothetical protein
LFFLNKICSSWTNDANSRVQYRHVTKGALCF